jgi:hypothetical protein
VTIDTDAWPYKALMSRGKAHVDRHSGVVPEFAWAARRYLGDQAGDGFLEQYRTWSAITRGESLSGPSA